MKTLYDQLEIAFAGREVQPMLELLQTYDNEKDLAKCYSSFAYLSCAGAGGSNELAERMGEVIEAFYLATSIHDDVIDTQDEFVKQIRHRFSTNTHVVLGDCFFVQLGLALARATPLISSDNRNVVIERAETFLLDVAESQIVDEFSQFKKWSSEDALRQMKLRGGTWGRFCVELPALAGGLSEEESRLLGDAGENLFLALTVRDDLRDLQDDIQNGVLTLAPSLYVESLEKRFDHLTPPVAPEQSLALIDLLYSNGAIQQALEQGSHFATKALKQLHDFLDEREAMNWYLLLMLFRLMQKRFEEFSPEHVREGRLGAGFAGDQMIQG